MARMSALEKKARAEGWLRDKQKDPNAVVVGTLFDDRNGRVLRVTHIGAGSLSVRTEHGRGTGRVEQISLRPLLPRITEEELERRKSERAQRIAVESDEWMCPNCWPGDRDGRAENDRDPGCEDHEPRPETVRVAKEGKRRQGFTPTPEEVAKVLKLRKKGLGYSKIEAEMGWPDSHGNRAWKIVKAAEGGKEKK